MSRKQLFSIVRDLKLPDHAIRDPITGEFKAVTYRLPATFCMVYPDGKPCVYVEMYLLDVSDRYTVRKENGGSLRSVVSSLSALLRFCWKRCQPWEMTDDLMKEAISVLKEEIDSDRPHRNRRDNNTIDRIITDWIAFFAWLQTSLFRDRLIVGLATQGPQVPLVEVSTIDRRGIKRTTYKYRYIPASSTSERKRPISREIRKLLWDAVSKMSEQGHYSESYKRRFSKEEFSAQLEYLRRRRELLLELLEATGARPSELAEIQLSVNRNCSHTKKLLIPTRKRRDDFVRSVPIDRGLAIRIEIFIKKYRKNLLDNLHQRGAEASPSDMLFISNAGHPITGGSFETEFSRIVQLAGIRDQQACMSMFRHRFITQMVKLHLIAFMEANPGKTRHMMTESDYRTILTKVAAFTGHKDESSLLHYIDLAWDEIGIFDYVKPAQELIRAVEQGLNNLSRLKSDLKAAGRLKIDEVLRMAIAEIGSIRDSTYAALCQHTKAGGDQIKGGEFY